MTQAPLPPVTPGGIDLNSLVDQVLPLVALVVVVAVSAVALRWVLRSPVGEALAERIRFRTRARAGVAPLDPHHVAALEDQIGQLQAQVSELGERLDFAERLLAERRERKLGAGP
ncbi:MAG TPA: hypothetical protein VEU55_08335 [Gemmatimonadales bacterium]|nr:hypothetical protein [Gemmatimonadales bacterium]